MNNEKQNYQGGHIVGFEFFYVKIHFIFKFNVKNYDPDHVKRNDKEQR